MQTVTLSKDRWEAVQINDAELIKEVNNCGDVPWTRETANNAAGNTKKYGGLIN